MNKKFLTKLLDKNYRQKVLYSIPDKKIVEYKIQQYARYTVDKAIIGRDKSHAGDKNWLYGFSPLEVLAYINKNNELVTKLFEFNTVNHFLKLRDGDTAVDVVKCILIQITKDNDDVLDFDIDKIDAGLKKIEDEYLNAQKQSRQAEDNTISAAAES